jgi:hypothetical protein
LGERNATRGLRVVGVTKHGEDAEEKAQVEKVARDHGMTAPTFLDLTGAWTKAADVRLEPTFLLLDRQGRLAYRHAGKLTMDSDAFAKMPASLDKM